jgi:uncharacterized LabA/DUF88 family protein
MNASSLHEIKKELGHLEKDILLSLVLRLARYRKENKELLSYLLFEAHNENGFIQALKNEIDDQLHDVTKANMYLTKKALRKVIRYIDRYIKYSGLKETEAEVRIHFCKKMKEKGLHLSRLKVIENMFQGQLKKINSAISKLNEDLQFDYGLELEKLTNNPN